MPLLFINCNDDDLCVISFAKEPVERAILQCIRFINSRRKRSDYNAKLNVVNTKREMTVRGIRMTNDEFCELDRAKRQLVNLRHRFATPECISLIGTLLFYFTSSFVPCDTLVLYAALAESRC